MLIPEIPLSEFKLLKTSVIKQMKSCAVTSDGELLFIAIIPPVGVGMAITDSIATGGEYLAARGNTVGGKTIQELKDVPTVSVPV